jgi:transcriptional regulator with XRE-family HTH domain
VDWGRLGERVYAERSRRWRTRADFADACGLSVRTLGALENAERTNFGPDVLAAVEAALGWEIGDARRVGQGREPRRRVDPRLNHLLDLWPHLSPDAQRLVVEFAERALPPQ